MRDFTLIDDCEVHRLHAEVRGERALLDAGDVERALGWQLKPQGLCRGDVCIPLRQASASTGDRLDLATLADLLDRPLAIDVAAGAAVLGVSAGRRGERLASLEAPDFTLRDLAGESHSLSDYRDRKVLLLSYASWCGCRHDLPAWESLHAELAPHNFTLISVALDSSPEAARPWIEAAAPTHPALVDTDHRVADLYRMINVPTVIWIDEEGRIARPNDVAFGNDDLKAIHGVESGPHHEALRAWVKENRAPIAASEIREHQSLPTPIEQQARAEYALGWHLHRVGNDEAAERHFARAEELAPHDFTIRRGSMPLRGRDPFGADFVELYNEWLEQGRPYYDKMRR